MKAKRFITSSGGRFVILPEADYDALIERLEDAIDVAEADRILKRIGTGEEELLPGDLVERILAGESRVRVWREHRGLSVPDLAQTAILETGILEAIESGQKEVSAGEIERIAKALRIDPDDLYVGSFSAR